MLLLDRHYRRATAVMQSLSEWPVLSTWTRAEFVAVAQQYVRVGTLPGMAIPSVLQAFDGWSSRSRIVAVEDSDIVAAEQIMRSTDWKLRAPDTLHVAICRRLGAELLTFDAAMASAALALGVSVVPT